MTETGIAWNEPRDLSIDELVAIVADRDTTRQPIAILTSSGAIGHILGGFRYQGRFEGAIALHTLNKDRLANVLFSE